VSDERIAWSRVNRGLYFVGFGTLLFLNTQGIVPWSIWREALTYWPVCLVALGLRLAFERTRAPGLVILGPLLVLGTLTWVALQSPPAWVERWETVRAERPKEEEGEVERWTVEGHMAMVNLALTSRDLDPSMLAEGRVSPAGRRVIRTTTRHGNARVRIGRPHRTWKIGLLPGRLDRIDLELARDLPLRLDLDLLLTDGRIDLTGTPVSRVALDGALNDLTLRLGVPESNVRIELNGTFNHIVLEVPPDTPVTTSTDGFLNAVDGRPGAGSLHGSGYHFDVDGAFNHLVVSSP
jgi:hypothetical protein